tara:strand:- start:6624 stop:6875 length:252 start_codon:yes stop_codon:yes gene_type:complete
MINIVYNNRGGCVRICDTSIVPILQPTPKPTPKPVSSNVCSSTYCQSPYQGQCRATTSDCVGIIFQKKIGDFINEPDYVWCGD